MNYLVLSRKHDTSSVSGYVSVLIALKDNYTSKGLNIS